MVSLQRAAVSLADVLARPDVWRADRLAGTTVPALASGFPTLDAQLPGGGWPRGALTEILAERSAVGECSLILPALARLADEGRWSLLVAPPYALNGAAWAAAGIDLARLVVVSPTRSRDALWAAEQGLASGALGALLCWTTRIEARQVRRLEVAAAGSNSLAFLFRPAREQSESSASALRLLLAAGPRASLAVNLLKRRGPPCARTLHLAVARPLPWRENDESPLARRPLPAPAARSQGLVVVA